MIRQHDQKTNRDLALVLDLRAVDETQKDACETALSFAATVFANLGTAVQGQVVLAVCGNDNLIVTDRFHPETVVRVMRCLGTIQTAPWNSSHPEDPLPEAVIKAAGCVSAGTPVFVISPGSERARTENWGAADNPRLSGVMSIMHWLQVGSTEFEQMFATSDPEQQQRVDALREKWTANVTR